MAQAIRRCSITRMRREALLALLAGALAIALSVGCENQAQPDPRGSAAQVPSPEPVIVNGALPTPEMPLATGTPVPTPKTAVDPTVEPTPARPPAPEMPLATGTPVPTPKTVVEPTVEPTPASPPTPDWPLATGTPVPTPEPVVEPTVEPTPASPPTPVATAPPVERVVVEPDPKHEHGCLNTQSGDIRTVEPVGEAPSELLTVVDQLQWVREAAPNSTAFNSAIYLKRIASYAPEVLEALLERRWVTNYGDRTADRHRSAYSLLRELSELSRRDKDIALQAVRHPIFDTLEWGDIALTRFLKDLTWSDPEGLHALTSRMGRIDASQSFPESHLGLLYLQAEFPEVGEEVAALPWVEDGLVTNEIDVLFAMARLSFLSPEAMLNVLEAGQTLLQQPTIQHQAYVFRDLGTLSTVSQKTALFLTRESFLDSTVIEYYLLVHEITKLARLNPYSLCRVMDHPAVSEGDNSALVAELPLIVLEATHPDAAEQIRAIPWIVDGVRSRAGDSANYSNSAPMEFEAPFVADFVRMQRSSPEFLSQLIQQPWLRDGLSPMELQVFSDVTDIGERDEQAGLAVLELPVFDNVNSESHAIVDWLKELIWQGPGALSQVLYHPSVRSASRDELNVAIRGVRLELEKPAILSSIDSLPWVNDGVGAGEKDALVACINLGIFSDSNSLIQGVLAKPWVRDGLNANELHAVRQLMVLARAKDGQPETPADKIVNMPFLDALDAADAAAIEALGTWLGSSVPTSIDAILSHRTLSGGITDDHTVMVAMLDMVANTRPDFLERLLDPELVTIEKRLIQTTYSGEILLAVLVSEPGANAPTMDILEQVVRHHEEFMEAPYPRGYVMLLVANVSDRGGGGGGARGFLTVNPGLARDATTIAHEVGHQYWPFAPIWIAEGVATFMEFKYTGRPSFRRNCTLADNLSGLDAYIRETVASEEGDDALYRSACAYSLGSGLFRDLYGELGDSTFRPAFTRLYFSFRDQTHTNVCIGGERGICYVRHTFVDQAESEEAATIAERIIDHWYDGPGQTESP